MQGAVEAAAISLARDSKRGPERPEPRAVDRGGDDTARKNDHHREPLLPRRRSPAESARHASRHRRAQLHRAGGVRHRRSRRSADRAGVPRTLGEHRRHLGEIRRRLRKHHDRVRVRARHEAVDEPNDEQRAADRRRSRHREDAHHRHPARMPERGVAPRDRAVGRNGATSEPRRCGLGRHVEVRRSERLVGVRRINAGRVRVDARGAFRKHPLEDGARSRVGTCVPQPRHPEPHAPGPARRAVRTGAERDAAAHRQRDPNSARPGHRSIQRTVAERTPRRHRTRCAGRRGTRIEPPRREV